MKQSSDARFRELVEKLRARGGRITPQRMAIVRVLADSATHPSAEDVYRKIRAQFPTTSLATVYKVIAQLKEMGEVLELGFADGSSRYDGHNPKPHAHLICVRCQKILDPDVGGLDTLPTEVARAAGYRLVGHRFDIYGVCPDCRTAEELH
ncbi:MAG: Fur family transcriptional regulator [Chthonomonadales bacterium]